MKIIKLFLIVQFIGLSFGLFGCTEYSNPEIFKRLGKITSYKPGDIFVFESMNMAFNDELNSGSIKTNILEKQGGITVYKYEFFWRNSENADRNLCIVIIRLKLNEETLNEEVLSIWNEIIY